MSNAKRTAANPPAAAGAALDDAACYQALQAHDARFDGSFFTAVTSTGIYCRPVCRVKAPRRENCRFFQHAAQAEAAGFRPCLRCRPELAPRAAPWTTQDASRTLAHQALALIEALPVDGLGADDEQPAPVAIAARLGISDRHLRRIFEAQFGVSPLQVLQTRRLLTAKQLIADTRLPMAQVAMASGFASVRRFNAAFAAHYGLNPAAMRRAGAGEPSGKAVRPAGIDVRLGYRPPYDAAVMMRFIAVHALAGLEAVTGDGDKWGAQAVLVRTLSIRHTGRDHAGWIEARFDNAQSHLRLRIDEALAPVMPRVIDLMRATFDLDADPQAIHRALHGHFPASEGLRLPGTPDGFELAVRAVLGQQITLAAARTIGGRLVAALGRPIDTPHPGVNRLFPTPQAVLEATSEALGAMGIVRQRQAAMKAIATEMLAGRLALHPGADVPATLAALMALPGIGDWTAQYIAMRALRWPDAWPAGDVALQKALGIKGTQPTREAGAIWAPWRSYATLRCWHAGPGGVMLGSADVPEAHPIEAAGAGKPSHTGTKAPRPKPVALRRTAQTRTKTADPPA